MEAVSCDSEEIWDVCCFAELDCGDLKFFVAFPCIFFWNIYEPDDDSLGSLCNIFGETATCYNFLKVYSSLKLSKYIFLIYDFYFRAQVAENMEIDAEELDLQFGIQTLQAEEFLGDCVTAEATICVHMSLDGGKKKKKRKPKTTPKVIKHKHKKRAKSLLDYFSVDDASGKVKRLKQESPAGAGIYMADHPDRFTCGKTGAMFYKLTADGKRLPSPEQKQPKKAEAAVKVVAKKKAKK